MFGGPTLRGGVRVDVFVTRSHGCEFSARSLRPGYPTSFEKLGKGKDLLQIASHHAVHDFNDLLSLEITRLTRAASKLLLGDRRGTFDLRIGLNFGGLAHRTGDGTQSVRAHPRLHENPQTLAPKSKPSLTLKSKRHQYVLEPPKCTLAIDRRGQLCLNLRVHNHRDEALHPPVLLTRTDGIDTHVVLIHRNARMHLRVSDAVDDTQYFPGFYVEIAVDLRGIVLERILQGLPIDRDILQRFFTVSHRFLLHLAKSPSLPDGQRTGNRRPRKQEQSAGFFLTFLPDQAQSVPVRSSPSRAGPCALPLQTIFPL